MGADLTYIGVVLTVIAACQIYLVLRSHSIVSTSKAGEGRGEATLKVELVGITRPAVPDRQWDALRVKSE